MPQQGAPGDAALPAQQGQLPSSDCGSDLHRAPVVGAHLPPAPLVHGLNHLRVLEGNERGLLLHFLRLQRLGSGVTLSFWYRTSAACLTMCLSQVLLFFFLSSSYSLHWTGLQT